jgi:hypothetical protein
VDHLYIAAFATGANELSAKCLKRIRLCNNKIAGDQSIAASQQNSESFLRRRV